jgi:hypothetical protein
MHTSAGLAVPFQTLTHHLEVEGASSGAGVAASCGVPAKQGGVVETGVLRQPPQMRSSADD